MYSVQVLCMSRYKSILILKNVSNKSSDCNDVYTACHKHILCVTFHKADKASAELYVEEVFYWADVYHN